MNEAPKPPATPAQPTTPDQPSTGEPSKSPYYPYPAYYPQYPPKKVPSTKKTIIIIVILIAILIIVGLGVILSFTMFESSEKSEEYSFDVIVAEGGHYKHTIEEYWYEDLEIELSITSSSDARFDIYIMDKDQYENSYGPQNQSINAFSTLFSWENVTEVFDTVEVHESDYREIYLVIDNTENSLTPNDANPTATIDVEVELFVTSEDYYIY